MCLFIYLQQVGNVFYSEETWRDLPLKKVRLCCSLFFSCLEGKRKFKCAAQWVLKNHVEKIKAKNVVYLYMRDEGSIHSHLGVPFFSKNKIIIIL